MKILVVVESIDIEDSSGSKANVALINNLVKIGYEVLVYHYTRKDIQLKNIQTFNIPEIKYSALYFISRFQRIFQRVTKWNLVPFFEKHCGFSFTFFNDTKSIAKALRKETFHPDLILTLSKGASFRPHYALLKCREMHSKWLAYIHDPYPFHYYPRPYNWVEQGFERKEAFFKAVSEKAAFSGFPSLLLQEWMGSYFPRFLETGLVIPHQNAKSILDVLRQNNTFPDYFDASKFNLLHAGNLMKQRSPKGLMDGYLSFLKNNKEALKDSKLILLGNASYHSKMLEEYDNPEIYICNGNVAFDLVYHLQKNVAVNIILESKSEISPFLPGKFPHCVEANKTILSLAPYYSETRRLLGDDYEYWSEVDDVKKIAFIIEKLYKLWKQNPDNLLLNRKDLEDYLSTDYLKKVINNLKMDK